ncbi:hypothetical protein CHRYSEOSP005_14900 [Chryseobacterium sp. Alg-005]|uniref:hypothetical protein n=1 Tax=Chryseobacterium sp. Alg-005 TaxID=3159516 RepID=UPI0035557252
MEYRILNIEHILGHVINENKDSFMALSPTKNISYSWGDQQELNQWIIAKNSDIAGKRAFAIKNTSKYPLIWLITPYDGNILLKENVIPSIKFIICSDTQGEWLNSTREKETMPFLIDIANNLIEVISRHKNTSIINKASNPISFKKVYNYPVSKTVENVEQVPEAETLDIWDAVTLKFDIKIDDNCLKNLKSCQ